MSDARRCSGLADARGRIAWRSPQAALWLHSLDEPAAPGLLPAILVPALAPRAAAVAMTAAGTHLTVRNLGAAALCETMLLLAMQRNAAGSSSRLADAA